MPPHSLLIKWSNKELCVELQDAATVSDLKRSLQEQTNVNPKRQKLLGLKRKDGKPAADEDVVGDLALKPGAKVILMGSPDEVIEQVSKDAEAAPEVADDLDIADNDSTVSIPVKDQPDVQEKLKRRISSVEVKVLNPPREGKKCLVLDIDYTLFDLGSSAERPEELARPYLHEFLAASYESYDIIIWSATSMKWVEVKMKELGVLTHPDYKVTCMLDHASMVTVSMEAYGVFDCKPLGFLWAKFPQHYTPDNTIMFDDLRRNFVMNPQNGLKIRAYKRSHFTRASDRELLHLTHYLRLLAPMDSISQLDHKHWEDFLRRQGRQGGQ